MEICQGVFLFGLIYQHSFDIIILYYFMSEYRLPPTQPQYKDFLMSYWNEVPYLNKSVNPVTALRSLRGTELTPMEIAFGEQLLQAIANDKLHHMIVVRRFGSTLNASLIPDPLCVPMEDFDGGHIGHIMSIFDQIQDPEEFPGLLGTVSNKIKEWTTQPSALNSPVGFNLGIAFDYDHRPGLVVGPLMPEAYKRLMEGKIVSNSH